MKRASYREGVYWIAHNDAPGEADAHSSEALKHYISVIMLADLFGVLPEKVAHDVVTERMRCQDCRRIRFWRRALLLPDGQVDPADRGALICSRCGTEEEV
jgi:hypothetical protein